MKQYTLAFAGSGAVKKETVEALLDDFLDFGPKDADGYPTESEHEIDVIFPASGLHYNDELQKVVDWTEYANLPYAVVLAKGDRDDEIETLVEDAETVTEVANVDKAIVDELVAAQQAGREAFLILLWNDEDEHAEIILDLAEVAGVKALDLTDALDVITFADAETEAPVAEPEPEPEPVRRGRRGRAAAKDAEEEPAEEAAPRRGRGRRGAKEEALEDPEEALTEEAATAPEPEVEKTPEPEQEATPRRRGKPRGTVEPTEPEKPAEAAPEEPALADGNIRATVLEPPVSEVLENVKSWSDGGAPTSSVDTDYLSGVLQSIFLHLKAVDEANGYKNLMDPYESPVTTLTREALEHVTLGAPAAASEPEEPVKRGRGRPRNGPPTVGYLVNPDGVYRKAPRGKPRAGETKVDLTEPEIDDLRKRGLIVDGS